MIYISLWIWYDFYINEKYYAETLIIRASCRNNADRQYSTTQYATAHASMQYIVYAMWFHVFLQEAHNAVFYWYNNWRKVFI